MDNHRKEHYLRVADALAGCQLVEFELKTYVELAFHLVRKQLAGKMPFKMSEQGYDSLGKLIGVFRQLNDNALLTEALGLFCARRNRIAHGAIAKCIDPDGELNLSDAKASAEELLSAKIEAERLYAALQGETAKISIQIWFDDLTNLPTRGRSPIQQDAEAHQSIGG